jgi:iron(III) transport system ATP-binding protein
VSPAVEVTDLVHGYGKTPVLRGLTLTVQAGDAVAVVGPSGGGKSTLLRLIAGLEVPQAGQITLNGQPASGPGWAAPPHTRGLSIAFQDPALWPHMRLWENVAFGLAHRPRAERRPRAEAWLAQLDLADLAERYPDEVSGGQAQRAALARALAPGAALLLLDEPFTHVEPALKDRLMATLHAHRQEHGTTLLLVTHDAAEAAELTDAVWVLADGVLRA